MSPARKAHVSNRLPRHVAASMALVLVLLAVSACAGAPAPAPAAPAVATAVPAQQAASLAPSAVPPTPTTVPPSPTPKPTNTPAPSPTPKPTNTPAAPAQPDAKADPMAALMYSTVSNAFRSAEFTYEMTMSMAPADDASAKALGDAAAALSSASFKGTGEGAVQIVDAKSGKANMRMSMDMAVMGQQVSIEEVLVGNDVWIRTNADREWKKSTVDANATATSGMDPNTMMAYLRAATKVQWLDSPMLNGEPTQHMSFSVDPSKIDLAALLKNAGGGSATPEEMQAILKNMTVDAEVWLAAKDLTLRQEKMIMSFVIPLPKQAGVEASIKANMDMSMRFDKINEPIKIEAPVQEG